MTILEKFKPSVNRRSLLLIAGVVWTLAGGILISRGLLELWSINHYIWMEILAGILLGTIFYLVFFARISKHHMTRITLISIDNPCFFSFFNLRGYIMMAMMITTGIVLRRMDIINHEILYTFYLTMGIPLLASAFRFFAGWKKNKTMV